MAEATALTSIAKSALQLFTSLAKDEFLLLWNCGEDLQKLKETIEVISCFLQDAEERKSRDHAVQLILSKLRKVMYDAQDLFDGLAAYVLHNNTKAGNAFTKEVRLFFSKSNQLGFICKTAHEVKSLRGSLDEIAKNMQQFSFIQHQPLDQPLTRKKTHSFVLEENIIGRKQEKADIIDLLIPKDKGETSRSQSFSVVAIIAFGGLGKTALAQIVYNDERVKQCFDVCLWCCVNYLSNLEQVLKEILASEVENKHLDLSLQKLQEKLREMIGGKKFFIVLDDVWDENPVNWLELENIICCGKSGSKVLVTTRSKKVAECVHALKPYYDLRGLSEEDAWSLFVKRASHGEGLSEHPELEPIGKKILSKCGNVPLAIVTVGSLLGEKTRDVRVWTEFYDNKIKEVLSSGDDNNIKQVLMVSYKDLHPDLKLCFAYCSLFPKDFVFVMDELVCQWLAHGILKPSADSNQSMEEVGETYFFHLVDRCFFQEVKYDGDSYLGDKSWTAKMHDLLHDLAIDVAKTESICLHKVPEIKGEIGSLRHISIRFELEDSFDCCSMVSNPKTVRTLLFGCATRFSKSSLLFDRATRFSKSSVSLLLASFTMLRVLYLSSLEIDEIPESIGRLIHLRYLDLSGNEKLQYLPNSIYNLHHLMIFDLRRCGNLQKLPPRIDKLASLRQLYIDGCRKLDSFPRGLRELTLLVRLDRLIVHRRVGGLRYLNGLDNLSGSLEIELPAEGWLDAIEDAKESSMTRKSKLIEMSVQWKRGSTSSEQKMAKDEAKAVLEALQPHENLECLRISYYGGEMLSSWFCAVKNVKELSLNGCDHVEYLEDGKIDNSCFPSLEVLEIGTMANLKGWWRQEIAEGISRPHLSKVSRVDIRDCPKLKGKLPLFEGIKYLRLIRVDVELVKELLVPNSSSFDNRAKLNELELDQIEGLISLPEEWIRHLTAVQKLTIEGCRALRWVSRRGLSHLTTLKHLRLKCGEVGDEDEDDNTGNEAGMPWKALQGLEYLEVGIGDMHLLEEGLQYLTLLKELEIEDWKAVEFGGGEVKGADLSFKALQNLHKLEIGFGRNKTFHLVESGVQHLRSLESLTIRNCKELCLDWNIKFKGFKLNNVESIIVVEDTITVMEQQSQQLRSLTICQSGAKWVDDIPWRSLSSLQHLTLFGMEQREQLPDGIQHLTSLQTLHIYGCEKEGAKWMDDIPWNSLSSSLTRLYVSDIGEREQLPDGIQHLTSLNALEIWGCEKVRSLPSWIPQLPSLTHLIIWGCSEELERRCERGRGEDWPLIRHIRYTNIKTKRNESRNEEASSRKMGWCGAFSLSKFHPKF